MKLLSYAVKHGRIRSVAIVIILMLLTIGFPTNVGGPWHLESVWLIEYPLNFVAAIFLLVVAVALWLHISIEYKNVSKGDE